METLSPRPVLQFAHMKTIHEWQRELVLAANEKYPINSEWTQEDRLMSMAQQLADVYQARMIEKKMLPPDPRMKSIEHRVAALIADTLLFCEMRGVDIEPELYGILDFFKDKNAKRSRET